jgi:dTDP-glucose 4,6-dehydratase
MKLLITGGAGFIGSNFIFNQVNKHPNDTFICVDKLTYSGNLITLSSVFNLKNFKFFKYDITNRTEMDFLFAQEKPDIVINFAAESHVDRSIQSPEIFIITNV